jgi:hypothetical protein
MTDSERTLILAVLRETREIIEAFEDAVLADDAQEAGVQLKRFMAFSGTAREWLGID